MAFSVRESWERILPKFMALSSFRKAFVGLSLAGIPTFIAVGWAVQAANVVTGVSGAIVWFTVAAVNATLFFWVWEEITELKAFHRRCAMVVLGIITVWLFHRGVNWAMALAEDAANANEIKDAREGLNDARTSRLFSQLSVASSKSPVICQTKPSSNTQTGQTASKPPTENQTQISAMLYNPEAPSIVVYNSSGRVADGITWGMIALRTSDLSYFGFATQSIGYIKAHSESAPNLLDLTHIVKASDGNGQILDGDELTGSINIDCAQCQIQTYIFHFVWGHSGWFYESKQKAGYIVPKDTSKEGRLKYIRLLTDDTFSKGRIEIGPKPPS